jgi:hypothetical protein
VDDPETLGSGMRFYNPPFQIISYCLRPVGDEIDSNDELVKGTYSSFRFDELNNMNVTAHIRFVYLTSKTIQRRKLQAVPLPDCVCYDARRCSLTISFSMSGYC